MSFESALCAELEGAATVTAVVGTKIYRNDVPPGTALPYIQLQMDGGLGHVGHMTGVSTLANRAGTVQCFQTTSALAEALATIVRKVLDGFRAASGTLGSGANTADVRRLTLRAPIDNDYVSDGSSQRKHERRIPFTVWLNEATS